MIITELIEEKVDAFVAVAGRNLMKVPIEL